MKKLISRTEAGAEKTYNVRTGLKKRQSSTSTCAIKNRNVPVKSESNKLTLALEALEAQVQRDRTARVASNKKTPISMSTDAKAATMRRSASKAAPLKSEKKK